jgi:hypothetical protein
MRWAPILALALVLAGCGGDDRSSTTATTTGQTSTETATGTSEATVFFYRGAALVPVTVAAQETPAVARAALERLLAGAPSGYETAVPANVSLDGVTIEGGVARATFSSELGTPSRTAQAQIISTLTRFPTVEAATIVVDGLGEVPLEGGSGTPLGRPATSDDYVDLTAQAPIFVRTPVRDSTVSGPIEASGTANVFEATFQVEVWSGDRRLRTETITASSGTGTRGTWSRRIAVPPGPAKLVFYEASAEDGRPLHTTVVNLTVR